MLEQGQHKIEPFFVLSDFADGKAIVNGGHLELESQLLVRQYRYALQQIGYTAEIDKLEVLNIIDTYNLGYRLNLDCIGETYNLLFEPELFPAVRLHFQIYEITVNVFHTGK